MAKVILICGRICSGKTHYSRTFTGAVRLSSDELMVTLFEHQEGPHHDLLAARAHAYLHARAVELVQAGVDVVLDWGFWTQVHRKQVTEYYTSRGIPCEWHYIHIQDADWERNIAERNAAVLAGASRDYFVDEGLRKKLLGRFEEPARGEMDVWREFVRE